MDHRTILRCTRPGLWLAVSLCLALPGITRSAEQPARPKQPGRSAVPPTSDWQYEGDEAPWVSPMPDDAAPPGGILSGLPQHPLRHMGFGEPLRGTSWLNRPYYVGGFVGTWMGASLIGGQVDQGTGFFSGFWLGTDLNHYWGGELRTSLFYVNTSFAAKGLRGVESRNLVGDANLLYYPWGDSRWRPYGTIGLGFAGFHFADQDYGTVDHTSLLLPIGLGVKYLCRNWLAVRMEIKDNIVFGGNGVDATGNWSFVGGVEVHWGKKSAVRYYPW